MSEILDVYADKGTEAAVLEAEIQAYVRSGAVWLVLDAQAEKPQARHSASAAPTWP